ncbi:MAG: bifunctional phosphopantothenoylcysteine decarboxylase/phosphopantothenate--cysteine ligase CoaBC [Candidatus Hydrothermarchaeaceae archaeon]
MSLLEKSTRLEGRRIAHCVTGSVAAIEAPRIARELRRHGAHVQAYMTSDAANIIHPYTMEFATGEGVVTKITGGMEHLASFDLVLVAPATASTISKMAVGIADSTVTALALASKATIIVAPSMALRMYENPLLQENIKKLKKSGCIFFEARVEEEKAKLPTVEEVVEAVLKEFAEKDLRGFNVLVTAGPTVEYIDPIRVITNKSSGRMGIEMAKEAYRRGADVKLVYGLGKVEPPGYLDVTRVETAEEMLSAVMKETEDCDVFVSAAAVADFTVEKSTRKIESRAGGLQLNLHLAPKILDTVRKKGGSKSHAILVAFKALDQDGEVELTKAAKASLTEYGVDVAVANDAPRTMGSEDAEVCIATRKGATHIPLTSKAEVAKQLWDIVAGLKGK